jgi:hypothetical protein
MSSKGDHSSLACKEREYRKEWFKAREESVEGLLFGRISG